MRTHRWDFRLRALLYVLLFASLEFASPTLPSVCAAPLPLYELQMAPEEWANLERAPTSNVRRPAKFIADGEEYSVEVRHRGDWARSWPKKPLKIYFEKDREFDGRRVLNLNSNWRDPAFIRERLAYQIYEACDVPSPKTRMVKLNLNGQFHGVFLEVEQPDKRFLERNDLEGAVLYKADSPGMESDERAFETATDFHEHYEKETHKDADYSDLYGFCRQLSTTSDVGEFFVAHVDLERYVSYLAAGALVQNWDSLAKNHLLVYDIDGTGDWLVLPWDLDRTFGDHWEMRFDAADVPLRIGTESTPKQLRWNRLFDAFYNEPALRERLLDRLEVLLEREFTEKKLFPVLDRWESELSADVALDQQRWPKRQRPHFHTGVAGVKTYIERRRDFLLQEIEAERARP